MGRQLDFGLFIQDDWRVSRKLVLNLGLRYDYFDHMVAEGLHGGPPHFANASFSNFSGFVLSDFRPFDNAYDSDPFSMGPRLGFAYNPDGNGKTVIRGGIGFMHAPVIVLPRIYNQPNPLTGIRPNPKGWLNVFGISLDQPRKPLPNGRGSVRRIRSCRGLPSRARKQAVHRSDFRENV